MFTKALFLLLLSLTSYIVDSLNQDVLIINVTIETEERDEKEGKTCYFSITCYF